MADLTDFLPIRQEDMDTIRARLDADVNAGLDPADGRFYDTTEGGHYYDLTNVVALELDRLWDFAASEVPAAMFPAFSYGDYLDEWGVTLDLPRKEEVQATGEVTFTGEPGTLVATGTEVATPQTNPDADPIVFQTLDAIVLAVSPGPGGLTATPAAAGGVLPAGTYFYKVTAITEDGETIGSVEASATVAGVTSQITLDWNALADATGYKVYRSTTTGAETLLATLGVVLTYEDDGDVAQSGDRPPTNTVPIRAVVPGPESNVSAGQITALLSPVSDVESLTNQAATTGGSDVESDELYKERILLEFARSHGAGTVADYERWALSYAGIGYVTVEPIWNGPGTVRVIVTDQENDPVATSVVSGLQLELDPVAGKGMGVAPIGATVTVATVTLLNVTVSALVTLLASYTLDGGGGSIAVRAEIERALKAYIDQLRPGEDVIVEKVSAQFFTVQGVYDVNNVELNGVASNVVVGSLQVARTTTVTL